MEFLLNLLHGQMDTYIWGYLPHILTWYNLACVKKGKQKIYLDFFLEHIMKNLPVESTIIACSHTF